MNTWMKNRTSVAAAALGVALLAPVGLATAANASTSAHGPTVDHAATISSALTVNPISFTKGERLYVSGTAAPYAEITIDGIPADTSQGFPMHLKGARAGADGTFSAGGIRVTADVDRFDVTFRHGVEAVTVTATATPDEAAAEAEVADVRFGSVENGDKVPAGTLTFDGRGEPGASVSVQGTNTANGPLATAVVAEDGTWTAVAVRSFKVGDYRLWAKQAVQDADSSQVAVLLHVR